MKSMLRIGVCTALGILLGGCALTGLGSNEDTNLESVKTCETHSNQKMKKSFGTAKLAEKLDFNDFTNRGLAKIDFFLDCFVGPADNQESRLLRGHMVVAVVTRYAAFNYTGEVPGVHKVKFTPYGGLEDDIGSYLISVEKTQLELRHATGIEKIKIARKSGKAREQFLIDYKTVFMNVNELYDRLERIKRMILILRLYAKAEKPTINRARSAILRALSTITGSVATLRSVVGDAANGLQKYFVIKNFGTAYRADVKKNLEAVKKKLKDLEKNGGKVTEEDWEPWNAAISGACARLAALAGTRQHCIPASN